MTNPTIPFSPIATSEDDLLELVLSHSGTVTGTVTPDVAGWLLRLNTHNRPMRGPDVGRFISILERGKWINTGEPIIVSKEGVVNDGQHRLAAIHESGIAAVCDVRFGIERAAFQATGTGRKRTNGDVLHIEQIPNAKLIAAMAKIVYCYDQGAMARMSTAVESGDILAIVEGTPIIHEVAQICGTMKMPVLRYAWFGGVLTLIARRSSVSEVRAFAQAVDSGQGEEGSGARRLHERLVQNAMVRSKMPAIDRLIMTVRAWNAWVAHRPISLLRVSDSERMSRGFPTIVASGRVDMGQVEREAA